MGSHRDTLESGRQEQLGQPSGWIFDKEVSTPGSGFLSSDSILMVNSWGSRAATWVGPAYYKRLDPPLNLRDESFTLEVNLAASRPCVGTLYFQFLDADDRVIVEAGVSGAGATNRPNAGWDDFYIWNQNDYQGQNIRQTVGDPCGALRGVLAVRNEHGAYSLLFNGGRKVSSSLHDLVMATRLRMGIQYYAPDGEPSLDGVKLQWLRLTRP